MHLTVWSPPLTKIKTESSNALLGVEFVSHRDVFAYSQAFSDENKLKLIAMFDGVAQELRARWRHQLDPETFPSVDPGVPKDDLPTPIEDEIPY